MKNQLTKAMYAAAVLAVTLSSCSKNNDGPDNGKPPVEDGERWITLTAAFPDAGGTPGNGGTLAYAVSHEQAIDPNHVVRIFDSGQGFSLKSQRTARVQGSEDGNFLYNIQYTGADGGVFNKYSVHGGKDFEEVGSELNTAIILGTSPRWTKAAEGKGVGVSFGDALAPYTGEAPNFVYQNPKGAVRIANIDLNTTAITNTGSIDIDLGEELESQGYHVWRADVPVLNEAQNKVFIGLGIRRHDVNGTVTYNNNGAINGWQTTTERDLGTTTLVVDYPTLRNPKLITSTVADTDNLSYRTMTQYVGTDGHIYQAATSMGSGHQILRISKSTDEYDNAYDFDLNTALGIEDAGIRAFRYIQDGIGVVLYTRSTVAGGYIALVDLNAKTATKLVTASETDEGFSGSQFTFSQYQNIGVQGDFAYVPLTPTGKDGNVYVINWKTKEITKGAQLVNQSGSHYLGAY
ncbi:hypothetical protein GCM10007415_31860 [Parapedobacter pyrenivorans]|uniref:DUF4374 domain-containing protein n=1 Tax=Parapedobacter pyrenivorans TaxID=1305674 RepID=A0A917HYG7_9SPHI|nr:hypothetical protein [Parapedobacter pyrenivorans]GGG94382.1 hypothetical protein GCM10007415_31860 [Parapedobacter pyrenivorans]